MATPHCFTKIQIGSIYGSHYSRKGLPRRKLADREERGDEGGRKREGDKGGNDGIDQEGDFGEDGEAQK